MIDVEGIVAVALFLFWIWALLDCIATDSSLCRNLPEADVDHPRADPPRHRRARLVAPRPAGEGRLASGLHRLRGAAAAGRRSRTPRATARRPRSPTAARRSSTGARALGARAGAVDGRPRRTPSSTRGSRSSTSARPSSGAGSSSSASASSISASSSSASATSTSSRQAQPADAEAPVQRRGRRRVGGQERLDRELGERDVERGAERRDHRDERELAVVGAQPHRDRDRTRALVRRRHGDAQLGRVARRARRRASRSSSSPVTATWRRRLPRMWSNHSSRFTMRGARPFGCSVARSTLHGGSSSSGRDAVDEHDRGAVRGHQVPAPVDEDRGIRLVRGEQAVDGFAHRLHLGRVEVGGVERRREAARDQQRVALAQRHVELVGEVEHHLAARPRPAGLDEAEMARRDAGGVGEIELAQPAAGPPLAQELPDRGRADVRPCGSRYRRPRGSTITSEGIDPPRRSASR